MNLLPAMTCIAALSSFATAQCELYYKFDRGVGNTVVNYGTAAVTSTMVSTGASPWAATGFAGGALRGSSNTSSADYAYVNTGFNDAISGSFTVSWWCKEAKAPGTALSYNFSGRGNFRCFTNGVAGTGLWVRAWGGAPADLKYPGTGADIFQTLARAAGGVHIALVVDGTALQAQWYANGAPVGAAITLTSAANVGTGVFRIGQHTSATNSFAYDTDEFRLCKRAATAAEIKAWHNAPFSGAGAFGKDCGIVLASSNSPVAGSANFQLNFKSAAAFSYLMVVGAKPGAGFDMGTVIPGLSGCTWYPQFLVELAGATATGSAILPVPIPAAAAGSSVEIQMLGLDAAKKPLQSNALSVKVEKN